MKKRKLTSAKKSAAILTAAALTVTTGAATVLAAESYQDAEKKALSSLVQEISESYQTTLEQYDTTSQGATANITLRLDDAGRSLLGLMVPLDISWLNDMNMAFDAAIIDGIEGIDGGLYLNGTQLCTFQMYVDMTNQMAYYCIPELSPSYLKVSIDTSETYAQATEDMEEELAAEIQATMEINEFYTKLSQKLIEDPKSILPEASVVSGLLDTYGNKVIANMIEGASGEETLSVEGISQNCMTYEGQIGEKEAQAMAQDILTAAKEDADLKALIETWAVTADGENPYEEFQKAVEESLSELEEITEASDDTYFVSKIWVNEEDTIVGRQLSLYNGLENSTPLLTWQAPSDGDKNGLLLEINDGQEVISLFGSGETTDGKANGTYHFAINSQTVADIVMTDYDAAAMEEGYFNGTYTITPSKELASMTTENGEAAPNPLANFGLVLRGEGDASSETDLVELTITSAGASLGSIQITAGLGDNIEIPDLSTMEQAYDMNNEADMEAYAAEMDFSSIMDKCIEAGVPEELVNALEASIEQSLNGETESIAPETETDAAA